MPTHKKRFKTIEEYIETFPESVQAKLKKMRQTIRKAAPKAQEVISYNIPTFKMDGKFVVSFAGYEKHIGLYPIPAGTKAFQKEIAPYKNAKSTLRFPLDKPIPYDLVAEVVHFRIKENPSKTKQVKKKYEKYHADGTLWATGTMNGKVMEGYWEWFRKEGTKMRSGYFTQGKQTGQWTTYDHKGKVVKVTQFS